MTRDYSKKSGQSNRRKTNRRKSANTKKTGAGNTFFAGLFIGLVLGVILTTLITDSDLESPGKLLPAINDSEEKEPVKPRFDFYTLLRESEVIVSENETPILNEHFQSSDEEKQTSSKAKPAEIYLLQVGSFKSKADADSLRVNLLLLNLETTIEKVSPKPGETWHRVLVGPMDNRADVSDAKSRLASNGIDSLLLKRKK